MALSSTKEFEVLVGTLKTAYSHVDGLECFLQRNQCLEVVRPGDSMKYKKFISNTLVCTTEDTKKLPQPPCMQQLSSQREVVSRILQRLCAKGKKNVLAFGYSSIGETSSVHVKFAPSICSYQPNTTTVMMSSSTLWETLLSRVGDDVMMYLLEHCSLFTVSPPSSCFQICGVPFYSLLSSGSLASFRCVRQRPVNAKYNVLSKMLKSRVVFYKRKSMRSQRQGIKNVYSLPPFFTEENQGIKVNRQMKRGLNAGLYPPAKKLKVEHVQHLTSHSSGPGVELLLCKEGSVSPGYLSDLLSVPVTEDAVSKDFKAPSTTSAASNIADGSSVVEMSDGLQQESQFTVISAKVCEEASEKTDCDKSSFAISETERSKTEQKNNQSCAPNTVQVDKSSHFLKKERKTPTQPNFLSTVYIKRQHMLYSSSRFIKNANKGSLLSQVPNFKANGKWLVETVFLRSSLYEDQDIKKRPDNYWEKKNMPKRYWHMRGLFQQFLKRDKRCPYFELLKKNCPIKPSFDKLSSPRSVVTHNISPVLFPDDVKEGGLQENKLTSPRCNRMEDLEELLLQYTLPWKVYTFVRECLHFVVPQQLWGSNHNKCRFLKNVKKFVFMGRFDKLSLQELMWKMRVNDCTWIKLNKEAPVHAGEHRYRETILAKFLFWLMETFVVLLLKSFFYITETAFQKNSLRFYRKIIWKQLQDIAIRKHLKKVQLQPLSKEELARMQKQNCGLVVSRLRFIPKRNGMRPIVKMGKAMVVQSHIHETSRKKISYFNNQLRKLHSVLNFECKKRPSLLGSSVFGMDDIYKALRKFAQERKNHHQSVPHYYFVKADVIGAYDSLPHKKLLEIISNVINPAIEENYYVRRYAVTWTDTFGQIRKSFRREVYNLMDFLPSMSLFTTHLQNDKSFRNAVLVEQGLTMNESAKDMLEFFKQMLLNNVLKIGSRTYVQRCGIPQGSVISTLLCSLCYGDMESKFFTRLQKSGLLLRLVDDFLLITPDIQEAKQFLRSLVTGIPEYGCAISPHKTVVNFPVDDVPDCAEARQLPEISLFPWCGLLLDTRTVEVFCDYGNYSGRSIRLSLTLGSCSNAGQNMRRKLLSILKLKCHSIYFDLQINSHLTIYINIYKIFLLQAYRFHACVRSLPFGEKVRSNPHFFLTVISEMPPCCYSIVRLSNKGICLGSRDATGILPFEAVQWLCYKAFITKLARHKSVYKPLLGPLKSSKILLQRKLKLDTLQLLKRITDPALPQDLAEIKD
ncbi:telomerase reverse transcriptase [Polypterus senegalus]|uniref:telomerase reverse transcriptase n=1 Tax=Polypterus senegalus TaxID=55291 RepID=UPI001963ED09|nr:telomerase reverse transcriptase [Polypterus senegalus]